MNINFSPYATNILDAINIPLITADGKSVVIRRVGNLFVIYVDGEVYRETDDNISASYTLNSLGCSYKKEPPDA